MVIVKLFVKKQITDHRMEKLRGSFLGKKYYNKLITENTDCYWIDESGQKCVLFKFRKKAISKKNTPEIMQVFEIFKKHSKKKNRQRYSASGSKRITTKENNCYTDKAVCSNISGYFDKPDIRMIKHFNTRTVCRTTAFTRDNLEDWVFAIPFFEKIGDLYRKLAPSHYTKQVNMFRKSPPKMRIGRSPFTTITSNYNWRTACHRDTGDFEEGMGNLTVLGSGNYIGGYVVFPQFKIAIDILPLDFLLMDVHQWHCNSPLKATDNSPRLSFVCYFRKNMKNCNKKKTINGETFYYKSKSS